MQCVLYQWIRLDKLYELHLMESIFQISESFFELVTIFKLTNSLIFKITVVLGLCMRGGGGICADQHSF